MVYIFIIYSKAFMSQYWRYWGYFYNKLGSSVEIKGQIGEGVREYANKTE